MTEGERPAEAGGLEAFEGSLPRAVALTWGMAADPQRGPKRELSHERIVEAAIAIADAEGLSAVTMSKVATSLGFTTMSLYRYVTSKEELLRLMQDAISEVPLPAEADGSDWRTELRSWALITHGIYQDHPWFVDIPVSKLQLMTPNNLRMAEVAIRAMRELSLSDQEKIAVLMLVSGFVRAFGVMERDLAGEIDDSGPWIPPEYSAAMRMLVTEEQFPFLGPLVQSGIYFDDEQGTNAGIGDDFAFGVERILDGIAAYVEGRPDPAPQQDLSVAPLAGEGVRRDKAVRDASRTRREAEARLREARGRLKEATKRENEAIKHALERAKQG